VTLVTCDTRYCDPAAGYNYVPRGNCYTFSGSGIAFLGPWPLLHEIIIIEAVNDRIFALIGSSLISGCSRLFLLTIPLARLLPPTVAGGQNCPLDQKVP
jgi:hypothetical protein